MRIDTTYCTAGSVDPVELGRHIAQMYRDVANEAGRDLHFPTGRPLAEAPGYPTELLGRAPGQAVSSFAGVGCHLGLAHLLRGERVLDLVSGSGMDVFAAASLVGPAGSRHRRGYHARAARQVQAAAPRRARELPASTDRRAAA